MKREYYLTWEQYFMKLAQLTSQRSKDPDTQVGACIIDEKNRIVGVGYNGLPRGCNDDDYPWNRTSEDKLEVKYLYVCHAEANALMNKNCSSVEGCVMYCTLFPCNECTKMIIQYGIKKIIYLDDKYHNTVETQASRRMLDSANIEYIKIEI